MNNEEAARIASAPARVNLLGEHVDHQGGTVLPVAVGLRTTVRYSPGEQWELDSAEHEPGGDWTRYVHGVIDLLEDEGHELSPGRIEITSTDPKAYPAIHANYLSTPLDEQTAIDSLKFTRRLAGRRRLDHAGHRFG